MKITETKINGCFIIENDVYFDKRGSFTEVFNKRNFEKQTGVKTNFVQDNLSISKKGVLRGLHFQNEPFDQSKLIHVVKGEVLDVIVDLRKESKTFGEHLKFKIGHEQYKSIFIPKGMAHGFLCISEESIFSYKCDQYYNPNSESGIIYNDADLNIDWEFSSEDLIISEKDKSLPTFQTVIE